MNPTTQAKLKSYIDRLERVDAERKAQVKDAADILAQAKSEGFDPKVIRRVLKLRKMSAAERKEAAALIETYMRAVDPQLDMFENQLEVA